MNREREFLVTCEHGGNRIPARYRGYFVGEESLLRSHRGYDPGALAVARDLARRLGAPLIYSTISRLLVDLNRSPGHPRLHGDAIRPLPVEARRRIVEQYYLPFRAKAEVALAETVAKGRRAIHVSSHSFTPVLDGTIRTADVGLLYDPARSAEVALCRQWLACLTEREPALKVRRNYPYTGRSDGFTSYLRRHFEAGDYIGVELEINQQIVLAGGQPWRRLRVLLIECLLEALAA